MITIALLLVFFFALLAISFSGEKQVPWLDQLYRVKAGVARRAEWMAPEDVVQQVKDDYLMTINWLQDSALKPWPLQLKQAPDYLSGPFLDQHQKHIAKCRSMRRPTLVGILRADHRVEVRRFGESGATCLVIDTQSERRMATYDYDTGERHHTQDMGSGAFVFSMCYDTDTERWKVDQFIQELPLGWRKPGAARRIELHAELSTKVGRDH